MAAAAEMQSSATSVHGDDGVATEMQSSASPVGGDDSVATAMAPMNAQFVHYIEDTPQPLASPAVEHWGAYPLDLQQFISSVYFDLYMQSPIAFVCGLLSWEALFSMTAIAAVQSQQHIEKGFS